jgi:hypothetical protein
LTEIVLSPEPYTYKASQTISSCSKTDIPLLCALYFSTHPSLEHHRQLDALQPAQEVLLVLFRLDLNDGIPSVCLFGLRDETSGEGDEGGSVDDEVARGVDVGGDAGYLDRKAWDVAVRRKVVEASKG